MKIASTRVWALVGMGVFGCGMVALGLGSVYAGHHGSGYGGDRYGPALGQLYREPSEQLEDVIAALRHVRGEGDDLQLCQARPGGGA